MVVAVVVAVVVLVEEGKGVLGPVVAVREGLDTVMMVVRAATELGRRADTAYRITCSSS